MVIDQYEANLLLFAFDDYFHTNAKGKVTSPKYGWSKKKLQLLRDQLFAFHEHSPNEEENQ